MISRVEINLGRKLGVISAFLVALFLIINSAFSASNSIDELSSAAERYVHLGLELTQAQNPRTKKKLATDIASLKKQLAGMSFDKPENIVRHKALSRNVRAMDVRVRMVNGETFSFTDEARLIYDVVLPEFDFDLFDLALERIANLLPGTQDLASRVDDFRSTFNIPEDRLEAVISASINECRARSKKFIPLPEQESFTLEYVVDKSWSGYNWYQGNNVSLMQINQDFPTKVYGAIGLGCHEGYPGHHVWNVLIEEELIKAKGWVEFNLYPLFSPYGLIAEGSAEYGVSLAFPDQERAQFEKDVLYPMAGVSSEQASLLEDVNQLLADLRYSRIAIGKL